jgi:hypothetical protein
MYNNKTELDHRTTSVAMAELAEPVAVQLESMLVYAARVNSVEELRRLWGFNEKAWEDCERLRAGAISSGSYLSKALTRKMLQRFDNKKVLEQLSHDVSFGSRHPRSNNEEWQEIFLPDELQYESCELETSICKRVKLLNIAEKRIIDKMLKNLHM